MPRSTARPSIWWNTGEWRASSVSRRNDAAGRDHVDRRRLRLHHAHLHGRGVRAQQHLLGLAQLHVERVLHRAGGMTGREVERLEVVPVELDLGTFGDLVAEADEHVFELAPDPRDRMQMAAPVLAPAEREVEPVRGPATRRAPRRRARSRRAANASLRPRCARPFRSLPDRGAIVAAIVLIALARSRSAASLAEVARARARRDRRASRRRRSPRRSRSAANALRRRRRAVTTRPAVAGPLRAAAPCRPSRR